jgi:hypothetical protein
VFLIFGQAEELAQDGEELEEAAEVLAVVAAVLATPALAFHRVAQVA